MKDASLNVAWEEKPINNAAAQVTAGTFLSTASEEFSGQYLYYQDSGTSEASELISN